MSYGFLTILFRHRAPAFWVFLLIILGGAAYALSATPKYESTAKLVVRFGDRSIPNVNSGQVTELTPADRREIVLSNAAILGSHDLAWTAIKKIGLARLYPGILKHPPARWSVMDEAVHRFAQDLAVDVGTQDNIITVSYRHPDKELAPKVVNALVALYVANESAVYQNPELAFLRTEVATAGKRLSVAQNALETFKTQWHITDYDQEVSSLLKQRGDVDINLRAAQANLVLAQQRSKDMARQMRSVPARQPEAASGEKYRALDDAKTQLSNLQVKQKQMLATYSPGSPAMATVNAGIQAAQQEVHAREQELAARQSDTPNVVYQNLQSDYLRNAADAKSDEGPVGILNQQLASLDQRLSDLQQNRGAFDNLTRARQIAEDTFRGLSQKYEDARVKTSLNKHGISPASLISQPNLPYRPARPRKLVILLTCLFCGAILAMAAALMAEAFDRRFATAEQVAIFLDLPVIASFGRDQRHVRSLLAAPGDLS